MPGTNAALLDAIGSMDRQIAQLHRTLLATGNGDVAATLVELQHLRRRTRLWLLNRRIEASKRVVDFAVWRSGNGIDALIAAEGAARRTA